MTDSTYQQLPVPAVRRQSRGRPSVIWLVPILAIAAAATFAIRTYLRAGPTLEITFETADGLEAGKSEVRYKNVPIGKVDRIALADDHRRIIATIKLSRGAAALAAKDSQFWVERPRIGIGGVSGLSTIVSGAYIGVNVGTSSEPGETFVGLEHPPGVSADQRGRRFKLTADDAGSLAIHTPIYLHRVSVGWISALELAPDGKHISAEMFIEHPYEDTVRSSSVFWNASGMDLTIDASGLRVDTQSLATVVAGGIAYDERDPTEKAGTASADTMFTLYDDRAHALARIDVIRVPTTMRFAGSMRGVGVGAALDFGGLTVGSVDALRPGYDPPTRRFYTDVDASLYPERLGPAYATLVAEGKANGKTGVDMLDTLVDRHLRAQIRSGNILTGQGYIALAWFPKAKKPIKLEVPIGTWYIPSEPGGVDHLQEQVQEIVAKLDAIPFDQIGKEAQATMKAAHGTIDQLHTSATSMQENLVAPDSAIQQSMKTTLEQVQRAAFSLRGLADYLQQHPESLLRGRGGK